MNITKCSNCGWLVLLGAKPDRWGVYRGQRLPIPADVLIPTCQGCGSEWLDDETIRTLDKAFAAEVIRRAALATFRRAMRRLERRARRLGRGDVAKELQKLRTGDPFAIDVAHAGQERRRWMLPGRFRRGWAVRSANTGHRRDAWLYERAAGAVTKLRAAGGTT